jgi:hypothetical protein
MKVSEILERLRDFPEDAEVSGCKCGEHLIITKNGRQIQQFKISDGVEDYP